jgi:hypothetical protein
MNINKAIHDGAAAQANKDARPLPKASTRRIKSKTEREAEYHQVGYGLHFCFHDRTYYEPCLKCRRSKAEALRNLSSL